MESCYISSSISSQPPPSHCCSTSTSASNHHDCPSTHEHTLSPSGCRKSNSCCVIIPPLPQQQTDINVLCFCACLCLQMSLFFMNEDTCVCGHVTGIVRCGGAEEWGGGLDVTHVSYSQKCEAPLQASGWRNLNPPENSNVIFGHWVLNCFACTSSACCETETCY